jgi:hypothetical protein
MFSLSVDFAFGFYNKTPIFAASFAMGPDDSQGIGKRAKVQKFPCLT